MRLVSRRRRSSVLESRGYHASTFELSIVAKSETGNETSSFSSRERNTHRVPVVGGRYACASLPALIARAVLRQQAASIGADDATESFVADALREAFAACERRYAARRASPTAGACVAVSAQQMV